MNPKLRFSLLSFLVACALISVAVGMFLRPPTTELSVHLVGNSYHGDTARQGIRIIGQGSHFHVVIENDSKETVRLWEEWNSWGYFNLTFELFDTTGKSLGEIQKKPTLWTRNFPSYLELKPNQLHVIDVDLHPKGDWNMPIKPMGAREGPNKYRLMVNYSVPVDEESKKYRVWTGTLRTKPLEIKLGYWPSTTEAEPPPPAPNNTPADAGQNQLIPTFGTKNIQ